jgi:lipopolysaccharide transport system permease protein
MKVTFAGAVKSAFVNFAQFRGVSTRSQYWYFVLFSVLMALVLGTIDSVIWPPVATDDVLVALNQPTPFSNVFAIVLLIPSLSVTSRRIRDAGWSGKWLWSLLLPCSMLAIYYFVFGYINQPVRQNFFSLEGSNIALTLFAGLNLHALLAECLSRAPLAITTQPSYVKRVVFPLHLLPFTVVGAAFVQFLLASGILFVAHFWLHGFSWALLAWPLSWLSLLVFSLGLCLLLSALTVYLRDIAQLTGFVSTFLLFMAPVFYPLASAPKGMQIALLFNPLTVPVETSRALFAGSPRACAHAASRYRWDRDAPS